jgi:DNA modification methylase
MEALIAHATVKPVALVADALLDCTAHREMVLNQFSGLGTTVHGLAANIGFVGFSNLVLAAETSSVCRS